MINRHFKINTLLTYVSNAIVMGSGFVLMFIINRYAGVEVYGELAIIIATSGMIVSLLTARSGEAVTRFFVREKTNKNIQNAKLVVIIGICVDIILSILIFTLFYILSDFIAITFLDSSEFSFVVWMYGFITISTFMRGSMIGYFQAHEYFRVLNFINVLESSLKVLFLLTSFFILNNIGIEPIIYSYIFASSIVTLFVVLLFSKRFLNEFKGVKLNKNIELIKEYFSFNMKTFFSTTLKAGNNNIDNLILGYFTDTKTVGVYQTLKNILAPVNFISSPFGMMTISKLTKLYSEKKYEKFKYLIKTITFKILKIALVLAIILYFLLPYILDVLKIENNNYETVFAVLIVYSFITVSLWWSRIFATIVNPMMSVYGGIYMLMHNIIFTSLATYIFGLIGLVLSTMIALIILLFFWIKSLFRLGSNNEN